MKRMVSVWLPHWPIERMRRARQRSAQGTAPPSETPLTDENTPFALIGESRAGPWLTALNTAARKTGLNPAMPLADARARLPSLLIAPAEPDKDAAALWRLAEWSMRFSPFVATDGADGLLLDLTGTAHLFGGEAAFLRTLTEAYAGLGLTAEVAIAPTIGAAWGLARYGPPEQKARIVQTENLRKALATLPVTALRVDEAALTILMRFGLKRIETLYHLPRAGLARRFQSAEKSAQVLRRLDEALGHLPEPLRPITPPAPARTRLALPEPLQTLPAIETALVRLAEALAASLSKTHEGAHTLWLTLYRVDGDTLRRRVGLSAPSRDAAHFIRLFKERLEDVDAGFGIDLMTLEAETPASLAPVQGTLTRPGEDQTEVRERLGVLLDRLANRLGESAIGHTGLAASHVPEKAGPIRPALASPAAAPEPGPAFPPRPFRLLERPEAVSVLAEVPDGPPLSFTWRRLTRRVARARGPERIAGEWWLEPAGEKPLRDYYEIEDTQGRRYWIFREGLFENAVAGGPPNWYVHGFFI